MCRTTSGCRSNAGANPVNRLRQAPLQRDAPPARPRRCESFWTNSQEGASGRLLFGKRDCLNLRIVCYALIVDSGSRKMSAEIVSLNGAVALPEAKPNETLVQELGRLLEAAKAGEIVGMAGAYQHNNRVITYSYAGHVSGYGILGGLVCLKPRLVRRALLLN